MWWALCECEKANPRQVGRWNSFTLFIFPRSLCSRVQKYCDRRSKFVGSQRARHRNRAEKWRCVDAGCGASIHSDLFASLSVSFRRLIARAPQHSPRLTFATLTYITLYLHDTDVTVSDIRSLILSATASLRRARAVGAASQQRIVYFKIGFSCYWATSEVEREFVKLPDQSARRKAAVYIFFYKLQIISQSASKWNKTFFAFRSFGLSFGCRDFVTLEFWRGTARVQHKIPNFLNNIFCRFLLIVFMGCAFFRLQQYSWTTFIRLFPKMWTRAGNAYFLHFFFHPKIARK